MFESLVNYRFGDDLEMQAVTEIEMWVKWPEVSSLPETRLEFELMVREGYDHKICVAAIEMFE
jgi:hypothetical protein